MSCTEQPFDEPMPGTLCLPPAPANAPAVVLLHGFASHKDEVGGFFSMLAHRLAGHGIASYRFTFSGFSAGPDIPVDTTFEAMLGEITAASEALAAHPSVDAGRIGLVGFSLGGALAVTAAAGNPSRYKSLCTWSCAADLENRFRILLGEAAFSRAVSGETIDLDLGWRAIRLGPDFIRSLTRHDPLESVRNWPGAFLAIAGSEDGLSDYLDAFHRNAPGKTRDKLLIPGADHIFNILENPARFSPAVIETTCAWLKNTL